MKTNVIKQCQIYCQMIQIKENENEKKNGLSCKVKYIKDIPDAVMTKLLKVIMEFFLNVSLNSVTIIICHHSKRARTCHLLCERPGCYHSVSKTHVRDTIFKLSPIHALVIFSFPEFAEVLLYLGKTPICCENKCNKKAF